MDVRLTDEGSTEPHFNTTTVGVCKCCGHAFVKSGKQNRKEYCGRPECQKERQRERARRKRQKDKLKAAQDKADKKPIGFKCMICERKSGKNSKIRTNGAMSDNG